MSEFSFLHAVPSGNIQLLDFVPSFVLQKTLQESDAVNKFEIYKNVKFENFKPNDLRFFPICCTPPPIKSLSNSLARSQI